MKHIAVYVVAVLLLCPGFFVFHGAAASPLEQTVSARQSVRSFSGAKVGDAELLEVLCAAYGYTGADRTVPMIGSDYSLVVFSVNASGCFLYVPESGSLDAYDLNVTAETIRSHDGGWPSDASVVIVVVWNKTSMSNGHLASAEAGCLVQNVYLAASSLNLGTCCVGGIDSGGLRVDLRLPNAMTPLLVMPLGYPTASYPPASPNYDFMTGNLPRVQYGVLSFEEALGEMTFVREWSADYLPVTELSQLLWAGYGYTNVTSGSSYHRTTPSSWGIYPLVVFVSNATGVYQYSPENHSLSEVVEGDKRLGITNAIASQVWASEAPAIFLIVYNSSYNGGNTGDGGAVPHEFIEVDAGAVVQQILLEASARNLRANVVSAGLEDWNGTAAEQLRSFLSMPSSLIPLCAVPVGFPSVNRTESTISVVSPENKTYGKNDVALTFIVKEDYSWIGYSIDGQLNVTVGGNTTLSLPDGFHHILVYANDTVGNMSASSIVNFVVDTTRPEIQGVTQSPAAGNVEPTDEVRVNATVVDMTSGVKRVTLNYSANNVIWLQIDMTNLSDDVYGFTIPQFPGGTNVTYVVVAEDNAGNVVTSVEAGYRCQYRVVEEFFTWVIIPSFMMLMLLTVVASRRKRVLEVER